MIQNKGQPGYKGYRYQIDTSVWCALDLFYVQKKYDSVVIEPASHEDIEVVPSEEANALCSFDKHHLFIQIKSRPGQVINKSKFTSILIGDNDKARKGPKSRIRPLDILQDKNLSYSRYILITDGIILFDKGFCVQKLGQKSAPKSGTDIISKNVKKGIDPESIIKRISIIEGKNWEYINKDTVELLEKYCHLPRQKSDDCRKNLSEQVRERLLGRLPNEWHKMEIDQTIREYGGLPNPTKSMSIYVSPKNEDKALDLLNSEHSILIYGAPGVGKTMLAEAIVDKMRRSNPPFLAISNHSADQNMIKGAFSKRGPIILFLDDPWGKTKLELEAVSWRNDIPFLLREVKEDKKIVIVSRENILQKVWSNKKDMPTVLRRITFKVSPDDYGEKERIEITKNVRKLSNYATAWHDAQIRSHWNKLTKGLPELAGYVEAIKSVYEFEKKGKIEFDKLIRKCNAEHLVETLSRLITDNDDSEVISYIIIWGLIHVAPRSVKGYWKRLEHNEYKNEAEKFSEWFSDFRYSQITIPILKTSDYLIDIGWIKYNEFNGLSFKDPRIEEAFEKAMNRSPDITKNVMTHIYKCLTRENRYEDALELVKKLKTRRLRPPESLLIATDNWLITNSIECHLSDFPEAFTNLGNWHTGNKTESIFASAFHPSKLVFPEKPSVNKKKEIIHWDRGPNFSIWSKSDESDISKNSNCLKLAVRFLQSCFSQRVEWSWSFNSKKIISKFHSLWGNFKEYRIELSEACLKGLNRARKNDCSLEGLIRGLHYWGENTDLENAMKMVLYDLKDVEEWYKQWENEYGKDLGQGVYDADYENHLTEEPGERFSPIQDALDEVVYSLGKRHGCVWLAEKFSDSRLSQSCVCSLSCMKDMHDLEKALNICINHTKHDHIIKEIYMAIGRSECKEMESILLNAIASDHVEKVRGALTGLAALNKPDNFAKKISSQLKSFNFINKIRLRKALEWFEGPKKHFAPTEWQESFSLIWSAEEENVLHMTDKTEFDEKEIYETYIKLSSKEKSLLKTLIQADDLHNSIIALLILICGKDEYPEKLLISKRTNPDPKHRYAAFWGLSLLNDMESLKIALKDKDYKCRRLAVIHLAKSADTDKKLRKRIIKIATTDKSALVREVCAQIIGTYRWKEGLKTIRIMLEDDRNISQGTGLFRGVVPNCHVARAAANALENFSTEANNIIPSLIKFLRNGKEAQHDPVVHLKLIDVLGKSGDRVSKEILIELLQDEWFIESHEKREYFRRHEAAWSLIGLLNDEDVQKVKRHIMDGEPLFSAALMLAVMWSDIDDFSFLYKIFEIRQRNEEIAWQDLLASSIFVKKKDIEQVKRIASPPLFYWFKIISDHPELFGNMTFSQIQQHTEQLDNMIEIFELSPEIRPAFSITVAQWMGDSWYNYLEEKDVLNSYLLSSYLEPKTIPILSTWNLAGYE